MRNPEIILNTLSSHSKVSDYKYERIYRILFNEEMFMLAYERIKSKPGNMTPGTDGLTIDGMTIDRIGKLIESLKNESYSPQPAKRVYIPKKNGKKRPLFIASWHFGLGNLRLVCVITVGTTDCRMRLTPFSPLTKRRLPNPKCQLAMNKGSEYSVRQRSSHSSPRKGKPSTWRRGTVIDFNSING